MSRISKEALKQGQHIDTPVAHVADASARKVALMSIILHLSMSSIVNMLQCSRTPGPVACGGVFGNRVGPPAPYGKLCLSVRAWVVEEGSRSCT